MTCTDLTSLLDGSPQSSGLARRAEFSQAWSRMLRAFPPEITPDRREGRRLPRERTSCGATSRTRTDDLRFTKPLLYQLSYRGSGETPASRPSSLKLAQLAAVLNLGVLSADSRFGGLGACGRSPERADRFESTPCQADRRPSRRSAMADLACGRASRRVPDSFYRRRPRDRRLLPQAPRPRARFLGS